MFIFYFLLGSAVIALGIFAIKHPDSWWFKRIGDDRERSNMWISYIKFAGKITIGFGALIILLSTQHLFF
ncbi:hypothetical protein [Paenibacillus sp. IHBB 10380]|uniref:hypothetical protein n=1 Tax=Paenibacillus sp. IHBB 10380 TaxID=1566358 RepID=UPI0005CFCBB9|nr:hypothetical protein [Paenibacillus sp. IHBB 10380]AJS59980.1 hypothetical protein UB51_17590 [Paenibacillus sp. IHBB 10380]